MALSTPSIHPWIAALRLKLEGLEQALLTGDAPSIETASAEIQGALKQAPNPAEFSQPGSTLRTDTAEAAQRFGLLRQTVLRASAKNQRSIASLMPEQASKAPTYGRGLGPGANNGAGQAFLSA